MTNVFEITTNIIMFSKKTLFMNLKNLFYKFFIYPIRPLFQI